MYKHNEKALTDILKLQVFDIVNRFNELGPQELTHLPYDHGFNLHYYRLRGYKCRYIKIIQRMGKMSFYSAAWSTNRLY